MLSIRQISRTGLMFLCVILALQSSLVEAQTTAEKSQVVDPLAGENLFRVFGGLILVLIMAVALIWLLKKVQRFPAASVGGIKLIGALSIGQRERIVVVQLGEEQLLLGVSPGHIKALHVLQTPLPSTDTSGSDRVFSFPERLKSVIEQGVKQ